MLSVYSTDKEMTDALAYAFKGATFFDQAKSVMDRVAIDVIAKQNTD